MTMNFADPLSILLPLTLLLSQTQLCSSSQSPPFLALPLTTSLIPSRSHPRAPVWVPFTERVALTVSVSVGTPPQNVAVVLDTGSELPWLRCNVTDSSHMGFHPTRSSSYSTFPCASRTCTTQTRDFVLPASCDAQKLCHAVLSYADGTSAEGTLSSDTFDIGGAQKTGMVFGCMATGFSSNPEEDSKTAGLLGMNRGSLSLVSQMGLSKFSYCICGSGGSGVLYLGDATKTVSIPPLKYTNLITTSIRVPYYDRLAYTVQLTAIKVSNMWLPVAKSAFLPDHTGAGQTIVDTGTQFSFLLGPVYNVMRSEYLKQTSNILRVLPDYAYQEALDLCYLIPRGQERLPPLPSVTLVFEGAEMVVDGGERLLYPTGVVRGNDTVQCFTFGNSDLLMIESFLIGHLHQRNMWMEFDLAKSRMGLAQFKCDRAAQKLP